MKTRFVPLVLVILLGGAFFSFRESAGSGKETLWRELSGKSARVPLDGPIEAASFSRLADRLSPTVVFITVHQRAPQRQSMMPRDRGWPFFFPFFEMPEPSPRQSSGSGFIIREDGYILTNHHVVANSRQVLVRLESGEEFEAVVVGQDPATDLALLKIDTASTLPVAPLGDSDALRIGHWVLAIGNPFGLDHSVTAGIVSAKGRQDVSPSGGPIYANFIQTDASINPGNSGGPLINMRGEVVGINTAIVAAGQGIGFAIPVNMAKQLLPQLATGRVERSYLGVAIQDISRDMARAMGLKSTRGALVASVEPDSPAAAAGVETGDVVVGFDNKPVESRADLSWMASIAGIGSTVALEVLREGKPRTVKVTLAAHPQFGREPDKPAPETPDAPNVQRLGVHVRKVPEELRRQERIKPGVGAYVASVERGGAGARAGLRPGDVVVKVGYQVVQGPGHFRELLAKIPGDSFVSLLVVRRGASVWVAVSGGSN